MLGPARGWDTPPLPTSLRARVGPRQRGLPTHWLWLREDLTGSMGAHPRGRGWTDVGPTKDRGLYGGWEAAAGSGLVLGYPLPPAPPRRLLLWVDCAEALDGLCRGSPGPTLHDAAMGVLTSLGGRRRGRRKLSPFEAPSATVPSGWTPGEERGGSTRLVLEKRSD